MNLCRSTLGLLAICAAVTTDVATGPAFAQGLAQQLGPNVCGRLDEGAKPQDYRTASERYLNLVERFHFTTNVEMLSVGPPDHLGGTISYTLRRFPNHHRALHAMARYALREKTATPPGSQYTIDCWFSRAMRFQPDDAMVLLTYGIYLSQLGNNADALATLKRAEELGESGANFHYNMGLLYTDLGEYGRALDHAHRAYAQGFNLPGLKAKLQRAGKWREPVEGQEPVSAPAEN